MRTLDIGPGERLDIVIKRCVTVANNTGETAVAKFNGTLVIADQGEDFATVAKRYDDTRAKQQRGRQ